MQKFGKEVTKAAVSGVCKHTAFIVKSTVRKSYRDEKGVEHVVISV